MVNCQQQCKRQFFTQMTIKISKTFKAKYNETHNGAEHWKLLNVYLVTLNVTIFVNKKNCLSGFVALSILTLSVKAEDVFLRKPPWLFMHMQ